MYSLPKEGYQITSKIQEAYEKNSVESMESIENISGLKSPIDNKNRKCILKNNGHIPRNFKKTDEVQSNHSGYIRHVYYNKTDLLKKKNKKNCITEYKKDVQR